MVPERAQRTILVETTLTPDGLRAGFAQCGVIRGVYPAGFADDPARCRYYVEYRDLEAVECARALQFGDAAVYILDSPSAIDQFLAIAVPDLPRKPQPNVLSSARLSPYHNHYKARNAHQGKGKSRPPTTFTIITPTTSIIHSLCPASDPRLPTRLDSINTMNDSGYSPILSPDAYMQLSSPVFPLQTPPLGSASFSSSWAHPDGQSAATQVSDSFPTMYGQPHGLQLDRLGLDEVINLLKATAGGVDGRAKWFTTGSDYYRSKDFPSAIAVLTVMIEVMVGNGFEESDLRPTILLLADCYRHLARKLGHDPSDTRATEDSKLLYARSIELLQKVFGASGVPSMFCDSVVAPASTTSSFAAPTPAPSHPTDEPAARKTSVPPTTPVVDAVGPRGTPNSTPPSSPTHGEIRILQREVQSLRDRHRNQHTILSRERSANRKLEDSLASERHRRRKLEEELKKAEKSAATARRGQESALDQCRVEHETRRQAEDELAELKRYIGELEPRLAKGEEDDRRTKDYLRRVGISLMRAASGDFTAAVPTLKTT